MSGSRAFRNLLRGPRRRDEEDGAVLAMTAFLTVVIITIAAFAVDLGLQRSAIRDMQSIADAAAMDAARILPSCDNAKLTTEANQSKQRHGTVIGDDDPLIAFAGHLDATGKFVAGSKVGGVCDAVRVTSATTVTRVFAAGDGDAVRSAVGTRGTPEVCFSVGTKTLTLNTSDGTLGPILDYILRVNLKVVGYEGIAALKDVQVPLLALAGKLNVGTPQELLNLSGLSLGRLMIATAEVMPTAGNAVTISLLKTLGGSLQGVNVSLGKILSLATGSGAGLNADINALDLIGAAIVAANGTNAIRVDGLKLTLPGDLVNSSSTISIIEPPVIACGPIGTTARSAQVRIGIDSNVSSAVLAAAGLNIAGVHLGLGINVGAGTAKLESLTCSATGGQPSVGMKVTTAAATIAGYPDPAQPALEVRLLGSQWQSQNLLGGVLKAALDLVFFLVGYPEIKITAGLTTAIGGAGPLDRVLSYPPAPGLPSLEVSGDQLLKIGLTGTKVRLANGGVLGILDALLAPLLTALTAGILEPLINLVVSPLLSALVVPLLRSLGIKLGVTEVTMLGRPSCDSVKLVETQG